MSWRQMKSKHKETGDEEGMTMKEAKVERVNAKGGPKSVKKSPVKKDKVNKKALVKPKPVKGPVPSVQKPVEEKVLTTEERIAEMEKQKVLNGRISSTFLHEHEVREFFYKMELLDDGGIQTTVKKVKICLNEESLGIILGVPSKGISSIEGCKPSSEFTEWATKCGDIKRAGLPKKFLRGEYQLMFEFINKVLVPWSQKRNAISATDLFLMEQLDELETINLSPIMLEHMHRVMTWKNAKHGIPYGYLLNHVFNHFEWELNDLTVTLNTKEVEIAQLKAQMQQTICKGLGTSSVDKEKVERLRNKNAQLLKTNASLSEEVQSLNKHIIQAHVDAKECMTLLLTSFTPNPPPS
ncbi:hypothetical protein KY284_007789 [Solanum tuberosum]|nr:hypothetical protein KY284_007789 [Solanum tuberosum]